MLGGVSEDKFVGPSAFARLCHVSRQAIHKAIGAGEVVKTPKGIDPKNATNKAYMVRALARATQHPEKSQKGKIRAGGAKKKAGGNPGSKKARKKEGAKKPEHSPRETKASRADTLRVVLEAAGVGEEEGGIDAMIETIAQKSYWDTLKVKEDVLKRQLDRAREVAAVADMRIIESEIGAFGQGIVANFIDSSQRQGIQICQMVGAEGKEKLVIEYLEKDNARRIAEAKGAVARIKKATLKAMTKKRRIA
jgi:hypothetical protein